MLNIGSFPYLYLGLAEYKAFTKELIWLLAASGLLLTVLFANQSRFGVLQFRGVSLRAVWIFSGILSLLISIFILHGQPNSADEFGYLYFAKAFRIGDLFPNWEQGYQPLLNWYMYLTEEAEVSTTLFLGWSLLLGGWSYFTLPVWLLNPLLSATSIVLLFVLLKKRYGREIATCASVLYASSAFVIFNGASLFPHTFAVVLLLLFAMSVQAFMSDQKAGYFCLALLSFGLALATRPFSTCIISVLIVLSHCLQKPRTGIVIAISLLGTFLTAASLYGFLAHGAWFEIPYIEKFHHGALSAVFSFNERGLDLTELRLLRFHLWSMPLLTPFWLLALSATIWKRKLDYIDWVFPCIVLAHLFYSNPSGNGYGPRYYFESYPFFVASASRGLILSYTFMSQRELIARFIQEIGKFIFYANAVMVLLFCFEVRHAVEYRLAPYKHLESLDLPSSLVFLYPLGEGVSRYGQYHIQDWVQNDPKLDNRTLIAFIEGEASSFCRLASRFPDRKSYILYLPHHPSQIRLKPLSCYNQD